MKLNATIVYAWNYKYFKDNVNLLTFGVSRVGV